MLGIRAKVSTLSRKSFNITKECLFILFRDTTIKHVIVWEFAEPYGVYTVATISSRKL